MTVKIIACEVMKEELLAIKVDEQIEYEFISMGLHLYPKKLHKELQSIINKSVGYSKIILAFGLCGGTTRDLKAADSTIILPRVHDCLPILLGSKTRYEHFSQQEKGTFYLSCGWMITEKNILSEHQRVCGKYGEKKAQKILARMYDSYKKVLFIHTNCTEDDATIEQSQEIAKLLNLTYESVQGENTYLHKIVNGPWNDEEFAQIPPFGIIEEELFGVCATK